MQAYCGEVVLIPNPYGRDGLSKRLLQLRSLASPRSFERLRVTVPALQQALDRVLRAKRFDVVNLEFPYLGHCDLRQAPPGERPPPLVVDSHEIAYDLARQFARAAAAWAAASTPGPTGASCVGRSSGPTAAPMASICAALADERRLLDASLRDSHGGHSECGGRRLLPAASHGPAAGRPHRGLLRAAVHRPQCRWRDPLRAGHLAPHRRGASGRALQDHRRPAAAFAAGAGRSASSSSQASCRTCGRTLRRLQP